MRRCEIALISFMILAFVMQMALANVIKSDTDIVVLSKQAYMTYVEPTGNGEKYDNLASKQEMKLESTALDTVSRFRKARLSKLLNRAIAIGPRYSLGYASAAYVLAYNGIDTHINLLRLQKTVASYRYVETSEMASSRLIEIYNRFPNKNNLLVALGMRSDGMAQEVISSQVGDIFVRSPNNVLKAIADKPQLKKLVADDLYFETVGDDQDTIGKLVQSILTQRLKSYDPILRSTARYIYKYFAQTEQKQ